MDAQIIATHHRPALIAALLALVVSLVACSPGVDVAVTGIPVDTQVSVDSLAQDIAAAPSKVYRYRGIGYAKVLGLAVAPSYTATARDVSGCIKATATVDYDGSDEVNINLRPVTGCGNVSAPPPAPIVQQLSRRTSTPRSATTVFAPDMLFPLAALAVSYGALDRLSHCSFNRTFPGLRELATWHPLPGWNVARPPILKLSMGLGRTIDVDCASLGCVSERIAYRQQQWASSAVSSYGPLLTIRGLLI